MKSISSFSSIDCTVGDRLYFHICLQNHIKATWNTFLPGEIQINERGFIFENKQIGFSMSTDPKLSAAGYNQSFAMFDFNTVRVLMHHIHMQQKSKV